MTYNADSKQFTATEIALSMGKGLSTQPFRIEVDATMVNT